MLTNRYVEPSKLDVASSKALAWLARRGVSVVGTRLLAVPGRRSGAIRTTVVNVLRVDGTDYLVAPRGETQWVRNLRAAGGGELRIGRRSTAFGATEVADDDKGPVLRAYLARWGWEVGRFFEGLDRHATPEQLQAFARDFPVFALHTL